jgi:GAF domain-containing protein/HAMP domain-containing protein
MGKDNPLNRSGVNTNRQENFLIMSSATSASIRQYRGRMARSVLFIFIASVLFTLILAGGAFYLYERAISHQISTTTFISVAILLLILMSGQIGLVIWLIQHRLAEPLAELMNSLQLFIEGNWDQRTRSERKDEIGALASLFNQMANDLVDTYRLATQYRNDQDTEKKGAFIQITRAAISSPDLDLFLTKALDLINHYYELSYSAIYLLEAGDTSSERFAALRFKAGALEFETSPVGKRFITTRIGLEETDWLITRAILSERPHSAPLEEMSGAFEAAVPIRLENQTLGALNLFSISHKSEGQLGMFSSRILNEVQALADIIALVIAKQSQTQFEAPMQLNLNLDQENISDPDLARRRLAELQTIWKLSQVISTETELQPLYHTIHQQVEAVMGELNSFAIALYDKVNDTIRIPYMSEGGQMLNIEPFPLGEGLTSIVVRNRRPLMLVKDTENQARDLGAKNIGTPAKSWLGVPMLFSGEVIGVIIAQDVNLENRFNEEDQRLFSTIAAQVAVVVRNAMLLETSRNQAELERKINEITAKIRRSTNIQDILQTTADELGVTLGARRAQIRLSIEAPEVSMPGANTPNQPSAWNQATEMET